MTGKAIVFDENPGMSETKKLVTAFDPARPEAQSSDFVIPWQSGERYVFRGLKSGKVHAFGIAVYVGRSVSGNDLFARLVDSGTIIADVDKTLSNLNTFLEQIKLFKVGNVLAISLPEDGNESPFRLELKAATPSAFKKLGGPHGR
jgi:hypothetical protein